MVTAMYVRKRIRSATAPEMMVAEVLQNISSNRKKAAGKPLSLRVKKKSDILGAWCCLKHKGKTKRPEYQSSDAKISQIFYGYINGIFSAAQAGFQTGESCLHGKDHG